jgi:hypothetical protein
MCPCHVGGPTDLPVRPSCLSHGALLLVYLDVNINPKCKYLNTVLECLTTNLEPVDNGYCSGFY